MTPKLRAELDEASLDTGIPIGRLLCEMNTQSKSALWCGYYLSARGFTCNPGYTDIQCRNYADKMTIKRRDVWKK